MPSTERHNGAPSLSAYLSRFAITNLIAQFSPERKRLVARSFDAAVVFS